MSDIEVVPTGIYGVMAEFDDANSLMKAAKQAYAEGYRNLDAFTPYPVHGMAEAIGFTKNRVPLAVLCGAMTGLIGGFGLQAWTSMIYYPMNVGGRPNLSWPSFVPVTFECTILLASLSAAVGMLVLNGLPMPYHPVFNNERFALRASDDGFFLCIESKDPKFDTDQTVKFLKGLNPIEVSEVEH